ncbi:Cationic amino acid transporter 3 [Desmophyllum pertusum]|uniref:Cationic amino acid transporter 3 n=1 Tax=Desmophyllum pertusum TaxID=174260 RepID=A0A9X0CZT5_9CNID|nr:Cationic amino acid transporter 3 [Desmophyllum pertusum]
MVTVIYCGLATVFTLIAPYNQLGDLATLATIFQVIPGAEYVAAVGAISATVSGMLSCLIAGSRVSFNMADDGLLFKCCIIDPSRTINNVILARGFISGCLAALFTTEHLIQVLSIGTLFAYTMVAISVLLVRYQPGVEGAVYSGKEAKLERTNKWLQSISKEPEMFPDTSLEKRKSDSKERDMWKEPNRISGYKASCAVFLLVISLSCLAVILPSVVNEIPNGVGWAFLSGGVSGIFTLASLVFLTRQSRNSAEFPVMVPCFPWLPIVTIFINILLITELNYLTFVRIGVWLVLELLIYAFYGYRRSNEALKPKQSPERDFIMYENPDVDAHFKKIQPTLKHNQDIGEN